MVDRVLAARVVAFLNELLEHDREAVAALAAARVPCNQALADHPTVQVVAESGSYAVGLLGVLNGLCGTYQDSGGAVAAVYEGEALVRFEILRHETPREA